MDQDNTRWKQSFFDEVESIRLKDPLSYVLGSMDEGESMVFTYKDVIKMAGHSCPSVSGAYMVTLKALKALYGDEIPVRGDIAVTFKGKVSDLTYGPMSQVISLITGASGETGFRGLGGGMYGRYNLLRFDNDNFEANAVIFERKDTGRRVKVVYDPSVLPANPRMGEVAGPVMSGNATSDEKDEFHKLWQGKVKTILLEEEKYSGLIEVTHLDS